MRTLIFSILISLVLPAQALQFKVQDDGPINGYFVGATAEYMSLLSVVVGNHEDSPAFAFNNQATQPGDKALFNMGLKGEDIVFKLDVITTGRTWYSDSSRNVDNFNHLHYYGDFIFPDGTSAIYIGFEDIFGGGDKDFDDIGAVFTNVLAVPEPETYAMVLAGLLIVSYIGRKRVSN